MANNPIFQKVRVKTPKRSHFDKSHGFDFSLNIGRLYPVLCEKYIPNSNWRVSSTNFLRFMPLVSPVMSKMRVFTHFFKCDYRNVWDNWDTYYTGSRRGKALPDEAIPVVPHVILSKKVEVGSLAELCGIPPKDYQTAPLKIVCLNFACMMFAWDEYYRDENLQDELDYELHDGDNSDNEDLMRFIYSPPPYRNWPKDYFTSALEWPQKGDAVPLPLYGQAPLIFQADGFPDPYWNTDGQPITTGADAHIGPHPTEVNAGSLEQFGATGDGTNVDVSRTHSVDLTAASGATINDLRWSMATQRALEKMAIGGTRINEYLLSFFGIKMNMSELMKPIYLGGGAANVVISEVLQQSETDTTPQGNMSGHALSVGQSWDFTTFTKQVGCVFGFMSVMPQATYSQGLRKMWTIFDRWDEVIPDFAHVGEEPILNKELYMSDDPDEREKIFGYTPRYAYQRFIPSRVAGQLRSTLAHWAIDRKFDNQPQLTEEFIEVQSKDVDYIFAVTDEKEDKLVCSIQFDISTVEPLPKYGTPI